MEGKDRAGQYTMGEEHDLAANASEVNKAFDHDGMWATGYRFGYRLAAEGESLPKEIQDMEPPTYRNLFIDSVDKE
jgi:hypothetical protein